MLVITNETFGDDWLMGLITDFILPALKLVKRATDKGNKVPAPVVVTDTGVAPPTVSVGPNGKIGGMTFHPPNHHGDILPIGGDWVGFSSAKGFPPGNVAHLYGSASTSSTSASTTLATPGAISQNGLYAQFAQTYPKATEYSYTGGYLARTGVTVGDLIQAKPLRPRPLSKCEGFSDKYTRTLMGGAFSLWAQGELNDYHVAGKLQRGDLTWNDVGGLHGSMGALKDKLAEHGCKRLLLPGRDTFIWAVMAAARGIPFAYIPGISRAVARDRNFGPMLEKHLGKEFLKESLFFDTGFVGTIVRRMEEATSTKFAWYLLSSAQKNKSNQLFRRLAHSRHVALKVEYWPKMLRAGSGISKRGLNITQYLAKRDEIIRAGILACLVYQGALKVTKPEGLTKKGGTYMPTTKHVTTAEL